MADNGFKVKNKLNVNPSATATTAAGDLRFDPSDGTFKYHNGTSEVPFGGGIAPGTITNSDIAAGAAIARSKIAAGTPNQIIINDGSGNLSSEPLITKAQGGTGADNSSVTFPSTGIIVTEAATETLTNKSISGASNTLTAIPTSALTGTVSAANGGTGISSTATFPASGIVVTEAATETLTNKSISGATNTLSAIPTSALTGTVSTSNGGTSISSTATFPSSGVIVTETAAETLTNKTIAGGSNTITGISLTSAVTGTLPLANGGTGQTSAAAAFNALSPLTTTGDLVYEASAGTAARLPIGSTNNVLTVVGGVPTWAAPASSGGTVTSASVVTANGLAGTVATATTTPAITLSTTVSGILSGNGTAISAAATTGSGSVVLATSPTLITPALGTPSSITLTSATGLPLTTGVTGTLPIANGGTGQTAKTAAFDALSPMTTAGDLIVGGTSGSGTRLAASTSGYVLTSNGTGASPTWQISTPTGGAVAPTVQLFTSGSGTYTTPTSPVPTYIRVRMAGAGGGSSGNAASGSAGNGNTGGNTAFGSSLLVANGGTGGLWASSGGTGGTASIGVGASGLALMGGGGQGAFGVHSGGASGGTVGGTNALGGAGNSANSGGTGPSQGMAGAANTGAGGSGGGGGSTNYSGAAGGAGGYVDAIINSPASTYAYAVGTGGTGGTAGTGGFTGSAGGSGVIIVEEYYPLSSTSVAGQVQRTSTTTSSSYTLVASSTDVVFADATSSAIVVNLPLASSVTNRVFTVKKIDASANTVTIDPNGSELIDGATTKVISSQNQAFQFVSNGTAWYIL